MGNGIKTFVIHLGRAKGRRARVDKLLKGTPYSARILDAVDGALIPEAERNAVISVEPLFQPAYPFAIGPGEYGCFQSHRVAWQAILDEDLDAALILEDDVALTPTFADAVALAQEHVGTFGYIQFQVRSVDESAVVSQFGGARIVQPRVTPLRTSAQLVSCTAARSLLAMTETIDRPVDTFLQSHWRTGLHLTCVVPSGVEDRTQETGGSTISSQRSIWDKVKREYLRGRYRRAVKRLSE
jgi:GR25 family glycosyltransferase involved in LPS biosynthesis